MHKPHAKGERTVGFMFSTTTGTGGGVWGKVAEELNRRSLGLRSLSGEKPPHTRLLLVSGYGVEGLCVFTDTHTFPFSTTNPYSHRTTEATQRTNRRRREAGLIKSGRFQG
jgi:hypothetical protein